MKHIARKGDISGIALGVRKGPRYNTRKVMKAEITGN